MLKHESKEARLKRIAAEKKAKIDARNAKRKAAAAELQISERTLYRKIKDYGLE